MHSFYPECVSLDKCLSGLPQSQAPPALVGIASKLAKSAAGLESIGLAGYPGLQHVMRDGDPNADALRQPADFYSPDTFNYNVLDVSADGKILTVTSYGIKSTVANGFVEYDPVNNPERALFSFQIRRGPTHGERGD